MIAPNKLISQIFVERAKYPIHQWKAYEITVISVVLFLPFTTGRMLGNGIWNGLDF